MGLARMLRGGGSAKEIAASLDALNFDARLRQIASLGRTAQRALYERAADSEPLTMDDLVPPGTPPQREVIYDGKNSLVLPLISRFQKRVCRLPGGAEACGYNEGPTRRLIGPGYFVLEPTPELGGWRERGAMVVDYIKLPRGPLPPGWPEIVPNSRGLQRFIFKGTRDFLRRVARGVVVGAAYRGNRPLPAWFVLCRRPSSVS